MDIRTGKTAGEDRLFPPSSSFAGDELRGGGGDYGVYEGGRSGFPESAAAAAQRPSPEPFRLKPSGPALAWQNQERPRGCPGKQTQPPARPGKQTRPEKQPPQNQASQIQPRPGRRAERLTGRPGKPALPPAANYDIIDSEELTRLYQKNTRLLSRLSSSGRQNGILQSEVCSLIEQKSKLGAQNHFLENKVMGLSAKLLLFSKQQRQFSQQAFHLKKEIGNLKLRQGRGESLQARQLRGQTQAAAKKLAHHIKYRQRVKKAHRGIKERFEERQREISCLKQREAAGLERIKSLQAELERAAERSAADLKSLMARQKESARKTEREIQEAQGDLARLNLLLAEAEAARQKEAGRAAELAKKQAGLIKERRQEAAGAKRLERQAAASQKEKARLLKKLESARQALKKNSQSVYKLSARSLKARCGGLEHEIQKLENQKRLLAQIIQDLKSQAEQALEEKSRLKAGLEGQIKTQAIQLEKLDLQMKSRAAEARGLLQKERLASNKLLEENSLLRAGRKSLQKALSAQEEGFQSLMLSFRRKYIKNSQSFNDLRAALKKSRAEAAALQRQAHSMRAGFQREKQSLQSEWEKQAKIREGSLSAELKSAHKRAEGLRGEIQSLREERSERARSRESAFEEEIKLLKLKLQNLEAQKREDRERHAQSLKSDYESRISGLNRSYDRKLRHIRTEMENDLCAEKRRGEAFQSMKEKQLKDMESALEAAQKEAHKLKTANFALENSQKEALNRLKKEIAARQGLADQNKHLQDLWHSMQKTSEEKDQKIQSLQSLNKSLSLSLSGGADPALEEEASV